jgi:hypothetical protein
MQFFKAHRSFAKNGLKQRKHFSPELHLLVLLKLLGSDGNTASAIVAKHGLRGKGSVPNYIRRATDASLAANDSPSSSSA